MSKYSEVAIAAAGKARNGLNPVKAWKKTAHEVFPQQPASRDKGCPKCAFLGLSEDGLIRGVPKGKYTKSKANKQYAVQAVELLRTDSGLSRNPELMWDQVMSKQPQRKQHNEQMTVVAALWNNGDIL